jgi:hypothetical protein
MNGNVGVEKNRAINTYGLCQHEVSHFA